MGKKIMWRKALAIALMPILTASCLGTLGTTANAASEEEAEIELVEEYAPEEAPDIEDEILIEEDTEEEAAPDIEEVSPQDDIDIQEDDSEFCDHTFFWKSAKNTYLTRDKMRDPATYELTWTNYTWDHVYFGNYKGKPLKWRVLDKETTRFSAEDGKETILLDCDYILEKSCYDEAGARWKDSNIKKIMNGYFTDSFSEKELSIVANSTKYKRSEYSFYSSEFEPLTGEKFFALDYEEAFDLGYGYGSSGSGKSKIKKDLNGKEGDWWLRSYSASDNNGWYIKRAERNAKDTYADYAKKSEVKGISPACNLDPSDILFYTEVHDGIYKLTLKQLNRIVRIQEGEKVKIKDREVTIPYKVEGPTDNNVISVMILSGEFPYSHELNPAVLYYEPIKNPYNYTATGTAKFTLPENLDPAGWGEDYRVYLMCEKCQGEDGTDYCSRPREIEASDVERPVCTVRFDLDGKPGTAPAAQTVVKGKRAVKPEDPEAEGYEFQGWYDGSTLFDFSSPVTKDLTLVASWKKQEQYKLWVGGVRVTEDNKSDIPVASGKASFDPTTNTLTFKDATITKTYKTKTDKTAAILVQSMPLTIKGDVSIAATAADFAICAEKADPADDTEMAITFDGNVNITGSRIAILSAKMDIYFAGGFVMINDAKEKALEAEWNSKITFADGMEVLIPGDARIIEKDKTRILYENDGKTPVKTAYIGKNGSGNYNLWVGGTQVTVGNQSRIKCDSGYAVYDPDKNILTFYDATVKKSYEYQSGRTAAIYSKNIPLTIRGDVKIDNSEIENGIRCEDMGESDRLLTIDGNVSMLVYKSGIFTTNKSLHISGGELNIKTTWTRGLPLCVYGKVTMGSNVKIISPEGAAIKQTASVPYYAVYESQDSTTMVHEVVIGSTEFEVSFDLNGVRVDTPATQTVKKGALAQKPEDPECEGYTFIGWYYGEEAFDFSKPVTKNMTLKAMWEAYELYDIWVGKKRVTAINASDVLGDGTAVYDDKTKTLTLNDAVISTTTGSSSGIGVEAMIATKQSLTIKGSATLTSDTIPIGIAVGEESLLKLDADLVINATMAAVLSVGTKADIEIAGGDYDFTVTEKSEFTAGIFAFAAKGLRITGGRTKINSAGYGIVSGGSSWSGSRFDMSDGTLDITSESAALSIDKYGALKIHDNLQIYDPIEGYPELAAIEGNDSYTIVDGDGVIAKNLKVGPKTDATSCWNLFEDDSVHSYRIDGISAAGAVENTNTKSKAFYDARLNGDTITVTVKGDRKKAAAAANSVLEFDLGEGGVVQYVLPVCYVKPSFKLDPASVTIKAGVATTVYTTLLYKAPSGDYEPYDMTGVKVSGIAGIGIAEDGRIEFKADTTLKGTITVVKDGWDSTNPVKLSFGVKVVKSKPRSLDVDLKGNSTVLVNSNAMGQSFAFDVTLDGQAVTPDTVTVTDKKETGLAKINDEGKLVIAYPSYNNLKAGTYTVTLSAGTAKTDVKIKVSAKALDKAVTLKVLNKLDVVTSESMVVVPTFKDITGNIKEVYVAEPANMGFEASVNEAGNIVIDYTGTDYDAKKLKIGNMKLALRLEGVSSTIEVGLKSVKAKKTTPTLRAAAVVVPMGTKEPGSKVIGTANILSTYKDASGAVRKLEPAEGGVEILSAKNVTASVNATDQTQIDITGLSAKSGSVKVKVTYPGGVTKNLTIKVSAKKAAKK